MLPVPPGGRQERCPGQLQTALRAQCGLAPRAVPEARDDLGERRLEHGPVGFVVTVVAGSSWYLLNSPAAASFLISWTRDTGRRSSETSASRFAAPAMSPRSEPARLCWM